MAKRKDKRITASYFYNDVVIVIAEEAGKAGVDVPSKDVIPKVLSRLGIEEKSLGVSTSRKDMKPKAILFVEWAFRNQRAKHRGKKGTAHCKQGSKRGMWALTEAGLQRAKDLGAKLPETEAEPEPEHTRQTYREPRDPEGFTAEQLHLAAARVKERWHRLVREAGLTEVMRAPVFELATRTRNWGFWNGKKRIFAIQARLAVRFGSTMWFTDTVAHELAHQYVSEVVKPQAETWTETSHGPTWKAACKLFGAEPKATAKDTLDELCADPNSQDEKVLRRVKKLLALADSPEKNEAELAALKAHEMMRQHHIETIEGGDGRWDYKVLGEPTKMRAGWLNQIVGILTRHYNVEAIWLPTFHPNVPDENYVARETRWERRAFVLEITGSSANVAIAEHVYDFLMAEGERRLEQFRKDGGGSSRTARLDFLEGLYLGFDTKLREQEESLPEPDEGVFALVKHEDEELQKFYRARYPRLRSTSSKGRHTRDGKARDEGRKQGKRMNVRDAVSSTKRGRALPSS